MGGMDVGVGFGSTSSQCAVSENGSGKGRGCDLAKVVHSSVVLLSQYLALTSVPRSQIGVGH